MNRTVSLLLIISAIVIILSGCNTVPNTVNSDGITRIASEEETVLQNISNEQFEISPTELLKSMPHVWEDVISLENEENYMCSATINGGDLSNYIVFDLVEKEENIEMLKELLMGDRKNQAVEVDDISAEGQKYWAVVDPVSGRSLEELHYYVYDGTVNDVFDYQRDTLIYVDQDQEIKISDELKTINDDDAISITANILAHMGYAGMTILDGYNY